jgi:ribosomal protein S3AE
MGGFAYLFTFKRVPDTELDAIRKSIRAATPKYFYNSGYCALICQLYCVVAFIADSIPQANTLCPVQTFEVTKVCVVNDSVSHACCNVGSRGHSHSRKRDQR